MSRPPQEKVKEEQPKAEVANSQVQTAEENAPARSVLPRQQQKNFREHGVCLTGTRRLGHFNTPRSFYKKVTIFVNIEVFQQRSKNFSSDGVGRL